MGTYLAAANHDQHLALRLYQWDRDLTVAFLGDLAILEVALRNAINAQLTRRWGTQWYADQSVPLDNRSCRQLRDAWTRITRAKTPGRLVPQRMFGFWRGLLDKGDHLGENP